MDRLEYFRKLHHISTGDYALLTENLENRSFKKGELIVVPGQVQKELYFVNKGVQMSFFETDNKTHVIAFTYYPDLCAIPGSFSFQKPSNYYLKCLSDTEMQYLSFEKLQQVLSQSIQLERLFRKMTEAVLAGIINRHMELHSLSIEQRYTQFCKRSPHLLQLVPHKYIASYLGINPTNFSKLYNSIKI